MTEASASMRGDDDEVRLLDSRHPQNFLCGHAQLHEPGHPHAGGCRLGE
jgi:hypothetical protein